MSNIVLQPNASGTGSITITTPNTNTDRTLNIPDVAGNLVTTGDTGTITGTMIGSLPSGSVIQVVDSGPQTTYAESTTTSYVDGNCTATITPTSASNKILLIVTQNIQVWNSSNYSTGHWKISRNIGGGAYSDIYVDTDVNNGNIFAYDYGGSGINVYRPTSYTMMDSPSTTSAVNYKTQIAKANNGGNRIAVQAGASAGRMILMEIVV